MFTGNPEITKALELKEGEKIYGPVIVGYPKENPDEKIVSVLAEIEPNKKEAEIKWI